MLTTFVLFGAAMLLPTLPLINNQIIFYSLLSLTVIRILPIIISLGGCKLNLVSKLFLDWFGPRGIASILLALIVLDSGAVPHCHQIYQVVVCTVFLSIILHGISAKPFSKLCNKSLSTCKSSKVENQKCSDEQCSPYCTLQ